MCTLNVYFSATSVGAQSIGDVKPNMCDVAIIDQWPLYFLAVYIDASSESWRLPNK